MKKIKFILNYSNDARDVARICHDKDNSLYYCSSIKINNGSIPLSSLINKNLEDIRKYDFNTRTFNAKSLVKDDIGVLREKFNKDNILYKIKVVETYDSSSNKNDYIIDEYNKVKKEVIKYIVEKTGRPFQVVKFFQISHYKCNADENLPKINWRSTLSMIRKEETIKELENLNWSD